MNLVLFEPAELSGALPRSDNRAIHIVDVLRRKEGENFDVGLTDGPRGKARIAAIRPDLLSLEFSWEASAPPPLPPITLLIGLPRPQTARKILQEAATLGVSAMHFVTTGRGESSYSQSTLWSTGEWRRHVLAGVAQAFCTHVPTVSFGRSLADTIADLVGDSLRFGLDNYEATASLPDALSHAVANQQCRNPPGVVLALGAERGWTGPERALLCASGFTLAHLGQRVLRTETAAVAALSLVKAACGWF